MPCGHASKDRRDCELSMPQDGYRTSSNAQSSREAGEWWLQAVSQSLSATAGEQLSLDDNVLNNISRDHDNADMIHSIYDSIYSAQ